MATVRTEEEAAVAKAAHRHLVVQLDRAHRHLHLDARAVLDGAYEEALEAWLADRSPDNLRALLDVQVRLDALKSLQRTVAGRRAEAQASGAF